jgi:3-oxo-5,6-didehydrosuberyl-CoA/3-oxoadipyl-CoA thiolase
MAIAARAIVAGEADLIIAGGVESMSRAPFVMSKVTEAFGRDTQLFDTTMGWRFVNPEMKRQFGVDTMPETAENVAAEFGISRADQDAFALRSQERASKAVAGAIFAQEIVPVTIAGRKGVAQVVDKDEHPRETSLDALSRLPTPFRVGGSVTAGNSSGINDGSAALLIASESMIHEMKLRPLARIVGVGVAGVAPRLMGMGPVGATRKVLARAGVNLSDMDTIELNEAFAAQVLAVMRQLGLPDDAAQVNPNGGAIALGHPLGASGTRLALTAVHQLHRDSGRYALCAMCVGVGQGIAAILERC